jgi:hypothetical protein
VAGSVGASEKPGLKPTPLFCRGFIGDQTMKLAIVGSRDFNDYNLLHDTLRWFDAELDCIISGGAAGADSLGAKFSDERHIECVVFPALWNTHGKAAGFIRNQQIVDACDIVLAFWDGKSKGTEHTISLAKKAKKPTFIVYF